MCLNLIKMSLYWKSRMVWMKVTSSNLLVKKAKKYETIYEYLQTVKHDSTLSQRILGALPH